MTPSDKSRFAEVLAALAASFGKEADAAMAEGYWMGLADIELAEFENACARAIRESEFFPKPVELRRLAGHIASDMRAVLAWESVCVAVSRHGYGSSVDFDDPLVNATIRNMGGWPRLCGMPSEEFQVWGRKEFERIYGSLCESGTSAESCAYLPGSFEGSNAAKGYEIAPPKRVQCRLPPHKRAVVHGLSGGAYQDNILRLVSNIAEKKSAT